MVIASEQARRRSYPLPAGELKHLIKEWDYSESITSLQDSMNRCEEENTELRHMVEKHQRLQRKCGTRENQLKKRLKLATDDLAKAQEQNRSCGTKMNDYIARLVEIDRLKKELVLSREKREEAIIYLMHKNKYERTMQNVFNLWRRKYQERVKLVGESV